MSLAFNSTQWPLTPAQCRLNGVHTIFDIAESPIETMFFNSLILRCAFYGNIFLKFTRPYKNFISTQSQFIELFKKYDDLWASFQKETKSSSIDNFLRLKQFSDKSDKDLEKIKDHIFYYQILQQKYCFHLTPQAVFNNVGNFPSLRADMVIWTPMDPSIKVIVECDGYEFHSSKDSFIKDRQRDRAFQNIGFSTRRYSGSEIFNSPFEASSDLFDFLYEVRFNSQPDEEQIDVDKVLSFDSEKIIQYSEIGSSTDASQIVKLDNSPVAIRAIKTLRLLGALQRETLLIYLISNIAFIDDPIIFLESSTQGLQALKILDDLSEEDELFLFEYFKRNAKIFFPEKIDEYYPAFFTLINCRNMVFKEFEKGNGIQIDSSIRSQAQKHLETFIDKIKAYISNSSLKEYVDYLTKDLIFEKNSKETKLSKEEKTVVIFDLDVELNKIDGPGWSSAKFKASSIFRMLGDSTPNKFDLEQASIKEYWTTNRLSLELSFKIVSTYWPGQWNLILASIQEFISMFGVENIEVKNLTYFFIKNGDENFIAKTLSKYNISYFNLKREGEWIAFKFD